ncbi:hypothetical protein FOA52_002286 [Chlamydomonas sp. UWO 241]|nr:hypothetical protein FOA52_002286 [Chlamydomonas sp. UWO 241]
MGQRVGSMLSAAALSALLLVGAPGISPPAAIAAETEVAKRAVDEYIAMGSKLTLKQLDEFRGRYKLRRAPDGRVQLKSMRGDWWSVRLDMEVPGALLLRDPSGNVYAVQTETVQQIDLSDDLVCLLMFADGAWEGQMAAIEFAGDDGKVKQLTLNDKEFREVIVLFSLGLWLELWRWLDRDSKAALRGVSIAMRGQVNGSIEVVSSPACGFSPDALSTAMLLWPRVTHLTLLAVSDANDLTPLTTTALARLTSLTVREAPQDDEAGAARPWDMLATALSSSVAATFREIDLSGCIHLRSIELARSCAQLRDLLLRGFLQLL